MGIYEELQARGLVKQVTNEPEIREMVNAGKAKFYIGFDCTADSLTAGHEASADGRQSAGCSDWRRHDYDWRPVRPH